MESGEEKVVEFPEPRGVAAVGLGTVAFVFVEVVGVRRYETAQLIDRELSRPPKGNGRPGVERRDRGKMVPGTNIGGAVLGTEI